MFSEVNCRLIKFAKGFIKPKWPRYRGSRAGCAVRERNSQRRCRIEVIQRRTLDQNFIVQRQKRRCNLANCVQINVESPAKRKGSPSAFLLSLYLSNVMSLAPKIDEIRQFASDGKMDLICITETWLKNHIHDNIIAIEGYNLIRRDRVGIDHGGICTYVKNNINFTVLEDLQDQNYEVLWIKLRPTQLPRGFSFIVVGNVYHPPSANNQDLLQYLHSCLSSIESRFF